MSKTDLAQTGADLAALTIGDEPRDTAKGESKVGSCTDESEQTQTSSDTSVRLRGGADAAFAAWDDDAERVASRVVQHRCIADISDDMKWDVDVLEEALLGPEACDEPRLEAEFRAHRVEPLPDGGTELLMCSLRQFVLSVALRGVADQPYDVPGLRVRVSLVYSTEGHERVEGLNGEAPLTGETEAALTNGTATLKLRVNALSYHHRQRSRTFQVLVELVGAAALGLPPLLALTAPLRSVARLPNERPAGAGAAAPAAASALAARQPSTGAGIVLGAGGGVVVEEPCCDSSLPSSPDTPWLDAAALSGGAAAGSAVGAEGLVLELQALRSDLQAEVRERERWSQAIVEQGRQLVQLAEQQRLMLAELQFLSQAARGGR